MKLRREIADGLHEGECQCPPSPQSVTDLHSEGRPSDRRHWARRCLNHFWRRKMCKVTCHILKNIHSLSQSSFCDPVVKKESKNWAHGAQWYLLTFLPQDLCTYYFLCLHKTFSLRPSLTILSKVDSLSLSLVSILILGYLPRTLNICNEFINLCIHLLLVYVSF